MHASQIMNASAFEATLRPNLCTLPCLMMAPGPHRGLTSPRISSAVRIHTLGMTGGRVLAATAPVQLCLTATPVTADGCELWTQAAVRQGCSELCGSAGRHLCPTERL